MLTALHGFAPEWYTPKGQDDDGEKTRFELTPLDGEQLSNLQAMMEISENKKDLKFTGAAISYALRAGLTGWENYGDGNGKKLKFDIDNFRLMPMPLRLDLASRIYETALLTGSKAKN